MIIANGYIEELIEVGGGLDEQGYPKRATVEAGEKIKCQYIVSRLDLTARGASGEAYVQSSFKVLIDEQELGSERLRLTTLQGKHLGDYSIISIKHLRAVRQVEVII